MSKGGGSFSQGSTTVNVNSMDMRTDGGWSGSTALAQAALVAVAGINTAAAISMNNKQVEIARGHLDLARELQNYFFGTFVPREQSAVAEAFAEPKYNEQYDMRTGQFVAAARHQFKGASRTVSSIGRYCTGLTAVMTKDLYAAEAIATATAANMAYRYEDIRKEAKDAVRWDHMIQSLGLGRNLLKESLAASLAAGQTFGDVAAAAGAAAGSALQGLGYFMGRNNTQTPQNPGVGAGAGAQQGLPAPATTRLPSPHKDTQANIPIPENKPAQIEKNFQVRDTDWGGL